MSKNNNEIQTYDGRKIKLEGQSVQDYEQWRDRLLREIGQDLASEFPKLYGSIEFNLQGGRFVNWNMKIGGK